MTKKEKLFSVTKKDLVFEYFSGTGPGGQNRNRNKNCCRCKHPPSGAVGSCQDHKSKTQNTKAAFKRMAESKKFQDWVKLETARLTGDLEKVKKKIEYELEHCVRTEVKDENGRWVKEKD